MKTTRDDEVTGALGRRFVEERRLDVDESSCLHLSADDPDHLRAQPDVALQLVSPKIEPAIPEPQRLVDVVLVELKRQRRRPRDNRERLDLQLHGTRGKVGIHRISGPRHDLTLCLEDEFVADLLRELGRRRCVLRVDHELGNAGAVTQVDEDKTAVIATPRRPPCERLARADVLLSELAAP